MKKSITVFVLATACVVASGFGDAFASPDHDAASPRSKAMVALHHDFPQAQEVRWIEQGNEIIAKFNSSNGLVIASYDSNGNLLSTMIKSNGTHIPFGISTAIDKRYPGYTPQDMTECMNKSGHDYYILLKNKKGNRINWLRIKSDGNGDITVIQKLHQTI